MPTLEPTIGPSKLPTFPQPTKTPTKLTACHPGTFLAEEFGKEICRECDPGHYASKFGSEYCTPCEPGFFTPSTRPESAAPSSGSATSTLGDCTEGCFR